MLKAVRGHFTVEATQYQGMSLSMGSDDQKRSNSTVPAGKLSVLVPVYNERNTILPLIERLQRVPIDMEILIADDGSSDGTTDVLRDKVVGHYQYVKVFFHTHNQGKGSAIRTVIQHATGQFSVIQDGDMEYDPNDFVAMMSYMVEHDCDALYGSRFINGRPKMAWPNYVVNRLLALLVRLLYGTKMTDEATCYKMFRTDLLKSVPLICQRFEFCPEVTAKVLRSGYHIDEIPIHYEARSYAAGKKIRWNDGVQAFWTLIRYRWWHPSKRRVQPSDESDRSTQPS